MIPCPVKNPGKPESKNLFSASMQQIEKYDIPLVGFCAYSGTGKTTLLKNLIPLLQNCGLRVAVIKHSHHDFEIDYPGKDSFELRKAGAEQILIASQYRIAHITELRNLDDAPPLVELLQRLDRSTLDLVLVEGYRHEKFPKIELHRPSLNKPLIFPADPSVIAIAVDEPLDQPTNGLPLLDLNKPEIIADFIAENVIAATS